MHRTISEMVKSSHPQPQAIAAALRTARASGGGVKTHSGPIHSAVAGRTDHLPMHVASGSYVIPADIISAMGEGNSMAGFKVAKDIFSVRNITEGTPYGMKGLPYGASMPHKADGGGAGFRSTSSSSPAGGPVPTQSSAPVSRASSAPPPRPTSTMSQPTPMASRETYAPPDRPSSMTSPAQHYTGLWDMVNGGGKGAGYTNLGDIFNGGGMNASGSSNPSGGGVAAPGDGAETPYKNTFFNKMKPMLGAIVGGPFGAMIGKGFQYDKNGDTGFQNLLGKASGGSTSGVPIVAAGGEYVIPPEDVVHIGGGDLDHGHKILDAFVKKMRQKTIKTLQNLPGPKRD